MKPQELQGLEALAKPSPFHLEEGWRIQIENKNRNCTHSEIDALTSDGYLNLIDFEIMKLLATYRYVNTHNLNFSLGQSLPFPYQKRDYQRNLKKLAHAGILLKHCICAQPMDSETLRVASPLRFYSLTPGSYSYISPIVTAPHGLSSALPDFQKIEALAASQALIQFHSYYGTLSQRCVCNMRKKIGSRSLQLDAFIRYRNPASSQPSPVDIFFLCGRSHPQSHENLIARMLLLFHWLDHRETREAFMILVLLESLQDIPKVTRRICARGQEQRPYPLYFALDTNILISPLFESLYQCDESDSDNKCVISRVALRI